MSCNRRTVADPSTVLSQENLLATLKSNGLESSNLSLDYNFLSSTQGVIHCIPSINILYDDLLQIPGFGDKIAGMMIRDIGNPQTLLQYAYRLLGATAGGFGPPLSGVDNFIINDDTSIQDMIADLQKNSGLHFNGNNFEEWEKLPQEFKKEILKTIHAIHHTITIIDQFAEPVINNSNLKDTTRSSEVYLKLSSPWTNRQLSDFSYLDIISTVDLKKLSFASRILSEQLVRFIAQMEIPHNSDIKKCIIETDFGSIGIYGNQNDTITGNHCFIINLGGDDLYSGTVASSVSIEQPVGIIIDIDGNDKYYCPDGFLVSGIMGIGLLFDLNGDDLYISGKAGIGASLYGTSMVYDCRGDDKYRSSEDFSQGAAHVGVAILVDKSGNDEYYSMNYSQGFGGTLGVGILIDSAGNDLYTGNSADNNISIASTSFVQGAARGRWAEASDGQNMCGGNGFLIDMSGDDHYYAKSFAQGAGYYFGLGMLYDNAGNDKYNSVSHSQGYAAHFALACFIEAEGDDSYNVDSDSSKLTQLIGSGRDNSAGWFIERSGDDIYHFGNRSVAVSDMTGLGVVWDIKGNDRYIWHSNSINRQSLSLGKSFKQEEGMTIDYRVFKPKRSLDIGLLVESKGKNTFIKY